MIDSSITHRICFFDVLLIINGLFIISLYEVLKVHSCNQSKCTDNSNSCVKLACKQIFDCQYKRRSRDETSFARECHLHPYTSGAEGIRTPDPLLARQVLSQLSYNPRLVLYSVCLFFYLSSGLKWTRTIDLTLIRRAL